ncbi:hypothetical protein GCM10009792_15650 [Microcella alkalica]|uniref:DUF7882 domain-containing protein n=1 Tax=Microcella alkalica TaxID=355930 RepID=A0A839EHY3_9MICO|nr:ATP-dependent DNA ligase [Microcella alkalica]MBA8848895.1 hypothetical protein [Microcella alkalica]
MGTLIYGSIGQQFEFDDRVLAHLQALFSAKLRRGESFFLNWRDPQSVGDGRSAVWIDNSVPLYFKYSRAAHGPLDREWLEEMAVAALGPQGLDLSDDPRMKRQVTAKGNSVKRKDAH